MPNIYTSQRTAYPRTTLSMLHKTMIQCVRLTFGFDKNMPAWAALIQSGKKDSE